VEVTKVVGWNNGEAGAQASRSVKSKRSTITLFLRFTGCSVGNGWRMSGLIMPELFNMSKVREKIWVMMLGKMIGIA
jgi:hypothetical protein